MSQLAKQHKPFYKQNSNGYRKLTKEQDLLDGLIDSNTAFINWYCYPTGTQKLRKHK